MIKKQYAPVYVCLRAAGYSIAETARLLRLSISAAWALEHENKEDIEVEAGVQELKRIAKKS